MNTNDCEISTVLRNAEQQLRTLIVQAAESGDYPGIDAARAAAGRVHALISEFDENVEKTQKAASLKGRSSVAATRIVQKTAHRKKKSQYPIFHVNDGVLHKVAWSKKDRAEYVHKVPREKFEFALQAIAELAADDKLFTSDQVIELLAQRGTSTPAYQVYVTLALLRHREIVQKNGRNGYSAQPDVLTRGTQLWSDFCEGNSL